MHNLEIRWIELWVRHSKDYTGHFLYSDEFVMMVIDGGRAIP